jgi:8-oxo-dGTP pyrophosphatase MutT (NUDIX family)
MTTQCVIVRDVAARREFWCETGIGLDWMSAPADVWVFESKLQAKEALRACGLGKAGGRIVDYSTIGVDAVSTTE